LAKLAIIGTGIIGTSLGLAIKKARVKDLQVVGTDLERGHASKAKSMGALDQTEGSLVGAVQNAAIVVIATPVLAMKDVFEIVGSRLPEGCLVTDTGSSKAIVMEWAQKYLPVGVSFVGGHPVVGDESSGPEAAKADLFQGRPYCIIPGKSADRDKVRLLTDMIKTIGGKPYYMDLAEHDSFVTAVSHLPLLLNVALVGCTANSPSWDDIAQVASTQYQEMTRLASNDPKTSSDTIFSNREGVVHWIDSFMGHLYDIRKILVDEGEGTSKVLEQVFEKAFIARAKWLAGDVGPQSREASTRQSVPSASEGMSRMFLGDVATQRRLFGREGLGEKGTKDRR